MLNCEFGVVFRWDQCSVCVLVAFPCLSFDWRVIIHVNQAAISELADAFGNLAARLQQHAAVGLPSLHAQHPRWRCAVNTTDNGFDWQTPLTANLFRPIIGSLLSHISNPHTS